ncbi:MAG: hypothetical protein ACYC06_08605 [Ilumatobacteraceae bacterium]
MKILTRALLVLVILGITLMWIYGLFFASRDVVNRVADEHWREQSEAICLAAKQQREALIDLRLVGQSGPNALTERAEIVDKATDTLEHMVNAIAALPVLDPKGVAIVPLWLADYRVYISDRRSYTALLRQGINKPFAESQVDQLPLSEKLLTFAADNRLTSCQPPIDLSV